MYKEDVVCTYIYTYIYIYTHMCVCVCARACVLVAQSCPALWDPHGRQTTRLLCPWNSPGKNTGMGCHCLLQYTYIYIHNGILVIKKNEIMPFVATWMNLEVILSEVSQTEKDRYMIALTCEIWKIIQINIFTQQKETYRKQICVTKGERVGEGIK